MEGLENAPQAFLNLLRGENFGKLLVRVSGDPTRTRGSLTWATRTNFASICSTCSAEGMHT